MVNKKISGDEGNNSRNAAHYRVRAYRDALVIIVTAIVSYFIFTKVALVSYIVSWMYHVGAWELDALAAVLLLLLIGSFVFILRRRTEFLQEITDRKKLQEEQARLINQLEEALAKIRTLSGLLPMCGWCKKIRDDQGYWIQVEAYLQSHTDATFTHGICPDCAAKIRDPRGTQPRKE